MGFWTQPLGKTLIERKGGTYYRPAGFGTMKTGWITLNPNGAMKYEYVDQSGKVKIEFHAGDVESAIIEKGEDYVSRTSGGRTAGGAAVGAVLLGPLGAIGGAGAGALAKKSYGAAELLIIELSDGRVASVQIARKHAIKARELRDRLAPA